jgi:hypothetical protein
VKYHHIKNFIGFGVCCELVSLSGFPCDSLNARLAINYKIYIAAIIITGLIPLWKLTEKG